MGSIAAIEAARFLKKSDLSDIVLGRIWDIADYQSQGCLDKKGFFIALKLIALAQTGKDIHLRNLTMEMPPPKMVCFLLIFFVGNDFKYFRNNFHFKIIDLFSRANLI